MQHCKLFIARSRLDRGWKVELMVGLYRPPFNLGAGYKGGATVYLSWHAVNKGDMYRPRGLQFGITRNASRVPWLRG